VEGAHERLRKWTADGTWERILEHVVVKDDAVGAVEWTISVDSPRSGRTSTPPAPGKGGLQHRIEALAVDGEALGTLPRRADSKVHLAVDGRGCRWRALHARSGRGQPAAAARCSTASG
jgi:hypothetical protein